MADALSVTEIHERLEYLRGELRAECISQGELIELQGLAQHIKIGDVELLEAAGVTENPDPDQRWDRDELVRDFVVEGFALGMVVVRCRSNGRRGTLQFEHRPRVYFGWQEDV